MGVHFYKHTDHVISVARDGSEASERAPAKVKFLGREFDLFRHADDAAKRLRHGKDVYLDSKVPMTLADIRALNAVCEGHEHARNREVKSMLGEAISHHFNKQNVNVTEFGCGEYPITGYLPANADITYHGIDCDPQAITRLQQKGISASGWIEAEKDDLPQGRNSIAVSVYAMHLMMMSEDKKKIAERILNFSSAGDGFFVGNYYAYPYEQTSRAGRKELAQSLREHQGAYIVLRDPADKTNEFWIAGNPESMVKMMQFAETLNDVYYSRTGAELMKERSYAPPVAKPQESGAGIDLTPAPI